MEINLGFNYTLLTNNNDMNLTKDEIIEKLKFKIDNEFFECVVFSPKYREQSKIALDKISLGENDEIAFFGGFQTYYGYYKNSKNNIYLFQIYQNQISINYL